MGKDTTPHKEKSKKKKARAIEFHFLISQVDVIKNVVPLFSTMLSVFVVYSSTFVVMISIHCVEIEIGRRWLVRVFRFKRTRFVFMCHYLISPLLRVIVSFCNDRLSVFIRRFMISFYSYHLFLQDF